MKIEISNVRAKHKKMEFSKKWLIGCIITSVLFTGASYALSFFDKQPLEALASTIVETLWGTSGISFVGYALQNCARAYTSSKFGIPCDEPSGNPEQLKGVEENADR